MASKVAIDKAAVLAEHFLLRHLAAEELGQLATYARMVHYPAGSTIVRKGDAGDSMLALVGGRVKICSTSPDGKELLLNIMKPGDIFGEIALLDGHPDRKSTRLNSSH